MPEPGTLRCAFHPDEAPTPVWRVDWRYKLAIDFVRNFDPFRTGWVIEPTTQTYAGVILPVVTDEWDGQRLTLMQWGTASIAREAAQWLRQQGFGAEVDELLSTQHARMKARNLDAFRRHDDVMAARRKAARRQPQVFEPLEPEAPVPATDDDDIELVEEDADAS